MQNAPEPASQTRSEDLAPLVELRHVRSVTRTIVEQALDAWTELWGEFEGRITSGVMVLPEAEKGFTPECGWPEFLERMWQLRFYLASINKVCAQTR
jgi:hypothetical protein